MRNLVGTIKPDPSARFLKGNVMSNQTATDNPTYQRGMTQFGIFYPVGYLVAGFRREADARQVQQELMTGGYDQQDCLLYTAAEVSEMAAENLENSGFLATLGRSDEAVRKHLTAAEKGASFLLIYAPSSVETGRAMNVIRRVPFTFVHRYHRLVIEELE